MIIHIYSVHGLFKGTGLELGRDTDNGGQIQYVWDLVQSLSSRPEITKVVLVTRLIDDPTLSSEYSKEIEKISSKLEILRIRCGGDKYLLKEELWEHWDEFSDNLINYLKHQNQIPDFIYSHYADAGYIAAKVSGHFAIPYLHHAHALGRIKQARLLQSQNLNAEDLDTQFKFSTRIAAEENTLKTAEFIAISTQFEKEFYKAYTYSANAEFVEIPPGLNLTKYQPYKEKFDVFDQQIEKKMKSELVDSNLPVIVSVARPTVVKNIVRIVKAYAQNKDLQTKANLVIYAGNWGGSGSNPESDEIVNQIKSVIEKNNLAGKVYFPPEHNNQEISALYRWAARKKGDFAMVSITEPFGLTTLEAAASGLPVVATNHGGPAEVVGKCENGVIVNPLKTKEISQAFESILSNREKWNLYSENGIENLKKYYTWEAHAQKVIELMSNKLKSIQQNKPDLLEIVNQKTSLLVCDIDHTLTGNEKSLENLKQIINSQDRDFIFAVASGRTLDKILEAVELEGIPKPDLIISSVGTQITFGKNFNSIDKNYKDFVTESWNHTAFIELLKSVKGITWQQDSEQSDLKISCFVDSREIAEIIKLRAKESNLQAQIIYSVGIRGEQNLDILPIRASKYRAIRHLVQTFKLKSESVIVAGDSGNDLDMLNSGYKGIVVANHTPELMQLKNTPNIYFAKTKFSEGVLEGLKFYKLITTA